MKAKDVIYVDVEDEITAIIDKVVNSKSKVVALVLPKRASTFQSTVNMKLLKRKADALKKNVVLVTSDKDLLPMAGVVGLHVAKTLQDQPVIPEKPDIGSDEPVNVDDEEEPEDTEIDNMTPIGELAGLAAVNSAIEVPKSSAEEEIIEIDNTGDDDKASLEGSAAAELASEKASKKSKKNKKLKVPNFNKFRNLIIIGVLVLILLIVGWVYAFKVLPRATITIQTNTSTSHSDLNLTLSSSQNTLDPVNNVVPAKIQTSQQTETSPSVNTTGSKTIGTTAIGTITVAYPNKNSCNFGCQADSIPAGTIFTDPTGNFSYKSNSTVTIPGCTSVSCHNNPPMISPVSVTAVNVGSGYNIDATSNYSSAGSTTNGVSMSSFNLSGTAMTGGSSQQVQVVAQSDISSAENQITAPSSNSTEQALEKTLEQAGFQPITQTFVASSPTYAPSAALNAQANSITVTATYNYTMYGVKQSDLSTLVTNSVNQQINPATQSILDTGVNKSTFAVVSATSTTTNVTMQTDSTIGPKLNNSTLLTQVAGKLSGDIKSSIQQVPGVTSVSVKYSPFWVTSTPKDTKKITIIIEKTNGSTP